MTDPVAAFCFDSAVSVFGSQLQVALESVQGKTDMARQSEQRRIIRKWIPDLKASAEKNFKDPASAKV